MGHRNRQDAGRQLAELLKKHRGEQPLVIALPRGGVPVAFEVAKALEAPLDILVTRKLGVPWQPELAMGAIAEGGGIYVNKRCLETACVRPDDFQRVVARETQELLRGVQRYRSGDSPRSVRGRTVVLVDDGIATGATVHAALQSLKQRSPLRVVLAVPVASKEAVESFRSEVDEIVCPLVVEELLAVGAWYDDFSEVTDENVLALLSRAPNAPRALEVPARWDHIGIELADSDVLLEGQLDIPSGARGLVVFVHGSGSSRYSSRNQYVATALRSAGLGTFLFNLLTPAEQKIDEQIGEYRFNVPLLAKRLVEVMDWVRADSRAQELKMGCFGSSTGAAAALMAAALRPEAVFAVVSRGGRLDLAQEYLPRVKAPVLLLVGSEDKSILGCNREAAQALGGEKQLVTIRGATHLFEEPGALEEVAERAVAWFTRHLPPVREAGLDAFQERPFA